MAETRVPVPKPKAILTEVYRYNAFERAGALVIRYTTERGKVFEREEGNGRGVVWYQVVEQ